MNNLKLPLTVKDRALTGTEKYTYKHPGLYDADGRIIAALERDDAETIARAVNAMPSIAMLLDLLLEDNQPVLGWLCDCLRQERWRAWLNGEWMQCTISPR